MAIVEFKDVTRIYTSGEHELKALDGKYCENGGCGDSCKKR